MKKALLAGIVVAVAVLLSGCMAVASERYVGPRHAHVVYAPAPRVIEIVPAPCPPPGPYEQRAPRWHHRW
jgi:uncharacterized protein YceK